MSDQLQRVKAYLDAIARKDVDEALNHFTEDAVIQSPAGTQQGKAAIRQMLAGVIARPAPVSAPQPGIENQKVVARGATPTGAVLMQFEFSNGLISRQSIGPG